MSETEYHYGKLKIVQKLENETLEEQCKRLLKEKENITQLKDYYHNDWFDCFKDIFYNQYIISNNNIYEIYDHFEPDDLDFFNISQEPDGTFTFIGSFYNGGTCLQECLEEELEKLNK